MEEHPAITALREYLRIRTDQPNPDYDGAVKFLKKQANRLGLPVEVHMSPKKPVVVITWEGKDPLAPSLLLNSHMDVVPVFEDKWSCDPFAATKRDDGRIYGRGTQDMKGQGIIYLEAISKLMKKKFQPLRTIHLIYVPDEEIGSTHGMKSYVHTDGFKSLNAGFAMDEAGVSPEDHFPVFIDERAGWALTVTCTGTTGHGSLFIGNTAAAKARVVIDEFLDRRAFEEAKLGKSANSVQSLFDLGHVTTINMTVINGGVQRNVVPDNIKITFDVRVSVDESHKEFYAWIQSVLKKAGDGVTLEFEDREDKFPPTKADSSNPFWHVLKSVTERRGIKITPIALGANTDSRFLRRVGVPSFGFTPMRNIPLLVHAHDEYITENAFFEAIDIYEELIQGMSSIPVQLAESSA